MNENIPAAALHDGYGGLLRPCVAPAVEMRPRELRHGLLHGKVERGANAGIERRGRADGAVPYESLVTQYGVQGIRPARRVRHANGGKLLMGQCAFGSVNHALPRQLIDNAVAAQLRLIEPLRPHRVHQRGRLRNGR